MIWIIWIKTCMDTYGLTACVQNCLIPSHQLMGYFVHGNMKMKKSTWLQPFFS